jgi:hypothetical protein
MPAPRSRRRFLRDLGIQGAALPFLLNLPGLGFANSAKRKQRVVFLFSPNGVIPKAFWPDEVGPKFTLKESLSPSRRSRTGPSSCTACATRSAATATTTCAAWGAC